MAFLGLVLVRHRLEPSGRQHHAGLLLKGLPGSGFGGDRPPDQRGAEGGVHHEVHMTGRHGGQKVLHLRIEDVR